MISVISKVISWVARHFIPRHFISRNFIPVYSSGDEMSHITLIAGHFIPKLSLRCDGSYYANFETFDHLNLKVNAKILVWLL